MSKENDALEDIKQIKKIFEDVCGLNMYLKSNVALGILMGIRFAKNYEADRVEAAAEEVLSKYCTMLAGGGAEVADQMFHNAMSMVSSVARKSIRGAN
jgi:hypothetical protein